MTGEFADGLALNSLLTGPFMNAISKPTILVADTDPTACAQVVRVLSRVDFNVFSAICHASALSAASKLNLDLVICDLSLWIGQPGQDLSPTFIASPIVPMYR